MLWGKGGSPGADDVLMQAALAALALGPEAREALLQGIQVRHLQIAGQRQARCLGPPSTQSQHLLTSFWYSSDSRGWQKRHTAPVEGQGGHGAQGQGQSGAHCPSAGPSCLMPDPPLA